MNGPLIEYVHLAQLGDKMRAAQRQLEQMPNSNARKKAARKAEADFDAQNDLLRRPDQTETAAALDAARMLGQIRHEISLEEMVPGHGNRAAACFALQATGDNLFRGDGLPFHWPDGYHPANWNDYGPRANVIFAAAVLIYEAELIDQQAAASAAKPAEKA